MIQCPRGCGASFSIAGGLALHLVEEHDMEHIAAMDEANRQTPAPLTSLLTGKPLNPGLGPMGLVAKHAGAATPRPPTPPPPPVPPPSPRAPEPAAPARRPSRYFPALSPPNKERSMPQDPTKRCARCGQLNAAHKPACPRHPANMGGKAAKKKGAGPPPRAGRAARAVAPAGPEPKAVPLAALIRQSITWHERKVKDLRDALALVEA